MIGSRSLFLPAMILMAAVSIAGCGQEADDTVPYRHLSRYGLFVGPLADQRPAGGMVPYDVVAQLYADGAGKLRFIVLPKGGRIHFDPSGRWSFPDGTLIVKTFYFDRDARDPAAGRRLLETRLLLLQGGEWTTNTYVWNDAQTEADWFVAGRSIPVQQIDAKGQMAPVEYRVPSTSQCKDCHGQDKRLVPLGPRTRQLNRTHDYGAGMENQIAHFAALGMFDGAVPAADSLDHLTDPRGTAPVEARARAYLDANCAHCHNDSGYASSTALRLNIESMVPVDLGVCRHPVAAGEGSGGYLYDVVPGKPESSIMVFRMKTLDAQFKMPQLPLTTSDAFGVDLVTQWIAALTYPPCK